MLERALYRPTTVFMGLLALGAGGILAVLHMPVDVLPNEALPVVSVSTSWGSTSPELVEREVTAPFEEALHGVEGVQQIESVSATGVSVVVVEFRRGTDMKVARLHVGERLSAMREHLPPGVQSPAVETEVPAGFRSMQGFMTLVLSAEEPAAGLRGLAHRIVAPQLRGLKGIRRVEIRGGEEFRRHFTLTEPEASASGFTREALIGTLEDAWRLHPLFLAPGAGTSVPGRLEVSPSRSDGWRAIAPRVPASCFRLGQLVEVTQELDPVGEVFRWNGRRGVTLTLEHTPEGNTLVTSDNVQDCVRRVRANLPPGVFLDIERDQSIHLRRSLLGRWWEMVLVGTAMIVILRLFYGNTGIALMVVSSAGVSLCGALMLLWYSGMGLNLVTLAGLTLALGRLVDDPIVVLEGLRGIRNTAAVGRTIRRLFIPLGASTAGTIVAFVPGLGLPPEISLYLREFFVAVAGALVTSLLVSCTALPLLWQRIPPGNIPDRGPAAQRWRFHGLYERLITKLSGHPYPVMVMAAGVLTAAGWGFYREGRIEDSWEDATESVLMVRARVPPGTIAGLADSIAAMFERLVLPRPAGVRSVFMTAGGTESTVRVTFTPEAGEAGLPHSLYQEFVSCATGIGGAIVSVQGIGTGFTSGFGPTPGFVVKIQGPDFERVRLLAVACAAELRKDPRVAHIDMDGALMFEGRAREWVLYPRLEVMGWYGVGPQDVRAVLSSECNPELGVEQPGRAPVLVQRGRPGVPTMDGLLAMEIRAGRHQRVPLGETMTSVRTSVQSEIRRSRQRYIRWLALEYRGAFRAGESAVGQALARVPVPPGYRVLTETGGLDIDEEERSAMVHAALWSLIAVVMVIAAVLESIRAALLVAVSVPFSLLGVFGVTAWGGVPFGRGGFAAVLYLTGIAVSHAVLMADRIRSVHGKGNPADGLVAGAAGSRLRPLLITALTTGAGLFPLVFLGGGTQFWSGFALCALSGLTGLTLFGLLVLPVFAARSGITAREKSPVEASR